MTDVKKWLNNEHKEVPEEQATILIIRRIDDDGTLLREIWFEIEGEPKSAKG